MAIFPRIKHLPETRNDLPELAQLTYFLNRLIVEENRSGIYVVGTSYAFSDHYLQALEQAFNKTGFNVKTWTATHCLDKRDGFPASLLKADIVLVPEPLQYLSGKEEEQTVTTETGRFFLGGTGLAAAFERLPFSVHLDGGIQVHVFKKKRPISREEISLLEEALKKRHPDLPYLFKSPL